MANVIAKNYGLDNYLNILNFDSNANQKDISSLLDRINDEIDKNNGKHTAITHYINDYGFIPPFVLFKVLSIGEISRYYGLLKQSDRQEVAKYPTINFYMLIRSMGEILDKKSYNTFMKSIDKEIDKLSKKIKSINIRNILDIMGYPNVYL